MNKLAKQWTMVKITIFFSGRARQTIQKRLLLQVSQVMMNRPCLCSWGLSTPTPKTVNSNISNVASSTKTDMVCWILTVDRHWGRPCWPFFFPPKFTSSSDVFVVVSCDSKDSVDSVRFLFHSLVWWSYVLVHIWRCTLGQAYGKF